MIRTKRPNISLRTFLVTLFCLGGAAWSARALYLDLTRTDDGGEGEPVAKVERHESKVRRRTSKSYQWNVVGDSQKLYPKDSVQTGPKSAATIKMLKDGSTLELGEDSLVVIDDTKELALNFMRGTAVVRRASGKDAKLTVDKDGKTKIEELPARLKAPDNLVNLFVTDAKATPVQFSWQGQADVTGDYELQLSASRAFKPEQTRGASARELAKMDLAPGQYFWRVKSPAGKLTETRSLRIAFAAPLQPVSPSPRQKMKSWAELAAVAFRWSSTEKSVPPTDSQLEIAADPEFKQIIRAETVASSNGTAALKNVKIGKLYWRLKSRFGDLTLASQALPFEIERAQKFEVELGKPGDSAALEVQPKIRFSWSSEAQDAEFKWIVADQKTNQIVASRDGKVLATDWLGPKSGQYKWRVTAQYGDQVIGESEWRQISLFQGSPLALREPKAGQKILYWDDPVAFEFEWEKDSLVKEQKELSYQLEVARDAEFKQVAISRTTRDTSLASNDLKLSSGQYHWRIKVVDASGQTLKASPPLSFIYGLHPTLPPPLPQKSVPSADQTIDVVAQEADPVLTWPKVDGAKAYEVTLFAPGRAPASRIVTDPQFVLKKPPEGKYQWTVRSIDKLDRKGEPMATKAFNITFGEPLGAPEATSSEVQ